MPRGHRRIVITVAGLAFVASALFLLVRDLSAVDSAYSHAATDAAVKYQRDAHAYIKERCFAPPGLGEIDCASKADEAAREGQRKEQDLAAQNITAWWTKVMGIAALIGMALSAIGVWLVKTTFDESQRANDIAATASAAEYEPRLRFHSPRLRFGHNPTGLRGDEKTYRDQMVRRGAIFSDRDGCYHTQFYLSAKNTGKTPAYDTRWRAETYLFVGNERYVGVEISGGVGDYIEIGESEEGLALLYFVHDQERFSNAIPESLREGRWEAATIKESRIFIHMHFSFRDRFRGGARRAYEIHIEGNCTPDGLTVALAKEVDVSDDDYPKKQDNQDEQTSQAAMWKAGFSLVPTK
jgi:hypothetical protein